jgi:hypothetical protein
MELDRDDDAPLVHNLSFDAEDILGVDDSHLPLRTSGLDWFKDCHVTVDVDNVVLRQFEVCKLHKLFGSHSFANLRTTFTPHRNVTERLTNRSVGEMYSDVFFGNIGGHQMFFPKGIL